jgi:hypothetical protein
MLTSVTCRIDVLAEPGSESLITLLGGVSVVPFNSERWTGFLGDLVISRK